MTRPILSMRELNNLEIVVDHLTLGQTQIPEFLRGDIFFSPRQTLLREKLYHDLVQDYGFVLQENMRTPGNDEGVVRDGVEVSGVVLPTLRVDVSVPVNTNAQGSFTRWRCKGKYFLATHLTLTEDNYDEMILKIEALSCEGARIYRRNK